jgi:signal transduction histidine kinase
MAEWDADGIPLRMAGAIVDIHERKLIQNRVEYSEAMLNEAGRMARVGTWELDLFTQEIFWSDTLKQIHQLPYDSVITSSFAKDLIADEYKELVISSTTKSINDKVSYDIEFQCIRPDNIRFWIRTIGWPVMDAKGKIVKLRGIMQDIDQSKKRELALINLPTLSEQNNRLINFAHIVSHNLRSHSGNLSLLLETYHKQANEEERLDIIKMLEKTAENLSETLEHLNEVVSIQSNTNQQKENCVFQEYLSKTCDLLETNLNTINASIEIDFQAESIEYVPAYMDSLFLNMLTNAIKYRDPNRTLNLKISSGKEGKNTWITFHDNGLGIDMNRHNDKVFGMYKTFHRNKDARGIGLFITRNQIESSGGSIQCSSVLGEGTCFKVIWA